MEFGMNINLNYKKSKDNYLFVEINERVKKFRQTHSDLHILNLGVGDVTLPMDKKLVKVMTDALNDQATEKFKGYPPETGYDFLKTAICRYYKKLGVDISNEDVFVSNGAGCDVGNILNLFSFSTAVIADPTYPAYYDSNILCGNEVILLPLTKQNGYKMVIDGLEEKSYLIYICSPNNPTGATMTHDDLKKWVYFANKTSSIILFDNAYQSFIEDHCPKSIYLVEGAKTCAIEIASFSKSAGFTNLRCGYTIVPKELQREGQSLNAMWNKRQCTFFNGVPYHIQKGAEFALSDEGEKICQKNINYYKQNAKILKSCFKGMQFLSSSNSPYIWLKIPAKFTSWQYFEYLLNEYNIVCVPGSGFGKFGEGYVRFSAFAKREDILLAKQRLAT